MHNYYDVLQVPRSASFDDIKRSYRSLMLQWHPDRNQSREAHRRTLELNEAFAVLKDSGRRMELDFILNAKARARQAPAPAAGTGPSRERQRSRDDGARPRAGGPAGDTVAAWWKENDMNACVKFVGVGFSLMALVFYAMLSIVTMMI
jgi:DnaJ-class molecular chaperone